MSEMEYKRRTVTFPKPIYDGIQKIRATFLVDGEDISFTTAVNMILLGGLRGAGKFDKEDWEIIASFLRDQKVKLDRFSGEDVYLDMTRSLNKKK